MSEKLSAGQAMPEIKVPSIGAGEMAIGGKGRWQLVVVYRGKHCPICSTYLKGLDEIKEQYAAHGAEIVVLSGDPKEKAEAAKEEWGLSFPLGYDLSVADMQRLGLYISNPRSPQETDRPFPEPALFLVNPEGAIQVIDISNAPFARPDLAMVAKGLGFIVEKGYPIRGTYGA